MNDRPEQECAMAEARQGEGETERRYAEPMSNRLQSELESQKEQLRQTQIQLEESHDRYLDLFDFSPIALFTLNKYGLIYEMNYAAAELFGIERKLLLNQRFNQYILPSDAGRWEDLFAEALNRIESVKCCKSGGW